MTIVTFVFKSEEIQGHQQTISSLKQSGSAESTDIQKAENKEAELEHFLTEHQDVACESQLLPRIEKEVYKGLKRDLEPAKY